MWYILSIISLSFALFQLFNVTLNTLFPQIIRRNRRVKREKISVLIPVRNEADNITTLLDDLSASSNTELEILVYDDHSTDGTGDVVHYFTRYDHRVRLIHPTPLPEGWLGKNHACHQLAQQAKGDYLLFVDADVRITPSLVCDSVTHLKKNKLGLLSILPKQEMVTLGEQATVPIMNYILLSLLPLALVHHSPFRAHSAANGQFMLFDAQTYKSILPHERYKTSAVEYINIARYFKRIGEKVACVTGEIRLTCRMYRSYNEALVGFSKKIFHLFGQSSIAAFLFWCLSAFGFIPIAIATPNLLLGYLIIIITALCGYASVSCQSIGRTLILYPINLLFMIHVMCTSIIYKFRRNYKWKGRNVSNI